MFIPQFIFITIIIQNILIIPTIFAETKSDIAICASKKNSVDRLTCFDSIATTLGVDAPKVSNFVGSGKWEGHTEQSPIDDSKNVYIALSANSSIVGRFGKNPTPVLHLRCKEKETEAYINFDTFLGSDSVQVTSRLDRDKAQTISWGISTDHNSAFAPRPIQFIKSLIKKESLLVQLTPYGENTVMTSFDVRGLDESIKPIQEACSWK